MQLIVLLLIAVIVVWLLRILLKEGGERRRRGRAAGTPALRGPLAGRPCPLCNSPLGRNERVQSVIYPGKGDRLVEVYGCPHCHPKSGRAEAVRICPACKQELRETDYVVGRMFERAGNRKHLHVLGCTRCRRGA